MASPKVFVSYRRKTSADIVGRIVEHLAVAFGEESVFVDIESIAPGIRFEHAIEEAIASSDVFLAIIGDDWLRLAELGKALTASQTDYVLLECETALRGELIIFPVLVGSASMPPPDAFPRQIAGIAKYNAAQVRTGPDFRSHMQYLIRAIQQAATEDLESGDVIVTVRFRRSGKTIRLKQASTTLMELAEEHGIAMDFGCRAGNCGTCLTRLVSGQLEYPIGPSHALSQDECLPCVAKPISDVEIDA